LETGTKLIKLKMIILRDDDQRINTDFKGMQDGLSWFRIHFKFTLGRSNKGGRSRRRGRWFRRDWKQLCEAMSKKLEIFIWQKTQVNYAHGSLVTGRDMQRNIDKYCEFLLVCSSLFPVGDVKYATW
jgi:hypothetical protein